MATTESNESPQVGFVTKLIATFFFSGLLPKAPGTWASMFTAAILYFVWPSLWLYQLAAIAVVYAIGVVVSGQAERQYGHDAHPIVIDEVAGQMIALFMAPKSIVIYILSFLLFRIFDIFKPPPARGWQDKPGGWGVMADDLAAGAYAAVVLQFGIVVARAVGITI
jgi:phosphatidylglycerophosphatase A